VDGRAFDSSERYYLLPEEYEQTHTVKSKKFIKKVIFLTAVAYPRFDELGNEVFSGKGGIFPFVHKELAKHGSKNWLAGIMVTTTTTSATKEVHRPYLIKSGLVGNTR